MKSEERKNATEIKEKSHTIIASFEAQKEKELLTLIATIIVDQTLKNAGKKGYPVPPV